MKVRFLGLGLNSGNGATLDSFMKYMAQKNGESFNFNNYQRFCYIKNSKNKKYVSGLFLTIKDQKKFCELKSDKGGLKVKVNTLDANSNLMDFNFFIINVKNGLCLYQHYHNSCSANQFGYFLHKKFKIFQDEICQGEKNKGHQKGLTWELMVRPEKVGDLLKELDTIRSFEIDFFNLKANESEFTPLTNYVTKERRTFGFIKKTRASELTPTIADIISKLNITNGRVFGKDDTGIEKIIKISENPDNFGEYEYDNVAEKLNALDINVFHKNWVIKELLKKADKYKHIFESSIKNEN